jgi:glycerol uptake facilitator-like aquaporin
MLDSVGVMGSSASRIFLPDEREEHPDTIAQVTMRATKVVRVSVIMGVFDGIAMNSARIFGELISRWVTMCGRHILRAR